MRRCARGSVYANAVVESVFGVGGGIGVFSRIFKWGIWVTEGVWECVSGVGVGCHADMIHTLAIVRPRQYGWIFHCRFILLLQNLCTEKANCSFGGLCNMMSLFTSSLLIAVSTTSFHIQNVTTSLQMNTMLLLGMLSCWLYLPQLRSFYKCLFLCKVYAECFNYEQVEHITNTFNNPVSKMWVGF
jgi:hypothetical protein